MCVSVLPAESLSSLFIPGLVAVSIQKGRVDGELSNYTLNFLRNLRLRDLKRNKHKYINKPEESALRFCDCTDISLIVELPNDGLPCHQTAEVDHFRHAISP